MSILGGLIRPLVAEAVSTGNLHLTEDDIEWIPQALEEGSIAPNFSIEIRTIGYPARKVKLDKKTVVTLQKAITDLSSFNWKGHIPRLPIWIQFVDPDGVHVM